MLPILDSPSLSPLARGLLNALVFLLSLGLLERSADVFVDSTAVVARRSGVPSVLVGLLTAGAEWEELAVVISSLAQGNPSLALSNIYGSSIANILGSFSLGLLVRPATLSGNDAASARMYTSLLVLLAASIAALSLSPVSARIGQHAGQRGMIAGRAIGGALIALFVLYVAGIAWGIYKGSVVAPEGSDSDSSDEGSDSDADSIESEDGPVDRPGDEVPRAVQAAESTPLIPRQPNAIQIRSRRKSTAYHLFLLLLSTLALSLAGFLLSATSTALARVLGLSQSAVGATVLSIATTLPEKLVAYKAGMKRQSGVLVANTVGSNVFLGTLVLGVVYVVRGQAVYDSEDKGRIARLDGGEIELEGRAELLDAGIVLVSAIVLWAIVWSGKFRRWQGALTLVAYIAYIVSVIVRSS